MSVRRSSLDWLLLAASLLLLASLAGAMIWGGEPSDTPGALPNPDHGILESTGPESASLLGWGYIVGLAILFTMTVCIVLGVRKAGVVGALGRRLILGCIGVGLIFTALVWTYRGSGPETGFFGGFPPATAWMIYGMWWFPGLMLVGMAVAFRRTWFTDADLESFRAKLAERAASDGAPKGQAH